MRMARHGILLVNPPPADYRRSHQRSIPALQTVANRPIVCHALQAMCDAAIGQIAVAVPDTEAEDVAACIDGEFADVDVSFVTFDGAMGTGNALCSAAEQMDDAPCVVHVADGLLSQPLAPLTDPMDDSSTDMLLLVHRGAPEAEQLDETARRLLGINDCDPARAALGLAGVCRFGLGALQRACARVQLVGDHGDFIAMAGGLVTAGGRTEAQLVRGWRRHAGEVVDLLDLNRTTLQLLVTDNDHGDNDAGNHIEGPVSIHPTAQVSSCVIVGPVLIGPRARVSHAYLGPYTSVGAGARIDGAEVEQSIISAEASIRHIGERLTSSVIGPRAQIHRDFALPRGLRLAVGEDVEVALP